MDRNQLKARLIARPEVLQQHFALNSVQPIRHRKKKEKTDIVLNPLPHLAEYQRRQNERPNTQSKVLGKIDVYNEGAGNVMSSIRRQNSLDPISMEAVSPLPDLPNELKRKQEEIDSSSGCSINSHTPSPPNAKINGKSSSHSTKSRMYSSLALKRLKDKSLDSLIDSGITNPNDILQIVRTYPNIGFLYMTTAVDKSSINYNPYNVKIVRHEHIDKSNHYTISKLGMYIVSIQLFSNLQ